MRRIEALPRKIVSHDAAQGAAHVKIFWSMRVRILVVEARMEFRRWAPDMDSEWLVPWTSLSRRRWRDCLGISSLPSVPLCGC